MQNKGVRPTELRRMTTYITLLVWILGCFMAVVLGDFVEPPLHYSMQSLAEDETRLPCQFKLDQDQSAIQVTWIKEKPDGTKVQIITIHYDSGHTEFGQYSGRVRFGSSDPLADSSLIILNTIESDEGKYTCQISTFPTGNFDRSLSLIVWTRPISSLDAVVLVEGQSFRQAAACRSVARPPPRLSWDSELQGQSLNRSLVSGSVSIQFSLHPLRSMNGKKLDCLVWHESLKTPRRITNNLVVHYPPNVEITGYDENWFAGLEGAALSCVSGGNPKPDNFTWYRVGGKLPEGASEENGSLKFNRPLALTDAGIYKCVAKNVVGAGTEEVNIKVSEGPPPPPFHKLLLIIVGAVAGLLVLAMIVIFILVTRHQKRRNMRLERELSNKDAEFRETLSRQPSFRRMNSVSTDARGHTEENIPLNMGGGSRQDMLTSSRSSIMDQGYIRGSSSTIVGAVDHLGRPVLHNSSKRKRRSRTARDESSLKVQSFLNTALPPDTHHLPPRSPSPYPVEQSAKLPRSLNGNAIVPAEGSSHVMLGPVSRNVRHGEEEDDGDEEDECEEEERGMSPRSEEQNGDNSSCLNSDGEIGQKLYIPQNNGMLGSKSPPKPPYPFPQSSTIPTSEIV